MVDHRWTNEFAENQAVRIDTRMLTQMQPRRSDDIMNDFANMPSPAPPTTNASPSPPSSSPQPSPAPPPSSYTLSTPPTKCRPQTPREPPLSSPTTANGHATAPPRPPCKYLRTTDSRLPKTRPRALAKPAMARDSRLFWPLLLRL